MIYQTARVRVYLLFSYLLLITSKCERTKEFSEIESKLVACNDEVLRGGGLTCIVKLFPDAFEKADSMALDWIWEHNVPVDLSGLTCIGKLFPDAFEKADSMALDWIWEHNVPVDLRSTTELSPVHYVLVNNEELTLYTNNKTAHDIINALMNFKTSAAALFRFVFSRETGQSIRRR
ncbi:hypothetical protein D915_009487 [Fasciola hepatica]|uniref:Uncharacterized protein n=1 Tax=Fasciola hepatica TaxID=6192 RepID=A0A4E0R346_FASHE|nr:hypothetical protein D915_009487 [Fasciola hepatica]